MPKVALHLIAKDENQQIKKIINDYGEYFDEDLPQSWLSRVLRKIFGKKK